MGTDEDHTDDTRDGHLPRLIALTCQKDIAAVRSVLTRCPKQRRDQFSRNTSLSFIGAMAGSPPEGVGGSTKGADVLLFHPSTPEVVSLVVQCKNQQKPLSFDDTKIELIKFEEKASPQYNCDQFQLLALNGFVGDADKLSKFNMLLDGWEHVEGLIANYDPKHNAKPTIELFAHNRSAYQEIRVFWGQSNRVAVVQPTGTGKSYLIAKAVSEFVGRNVVVMAPSNYILDQLRSKIPWVSKHTRFLTYAKGCLLGSAEVAALTPSLLVLDELHRCGARSGGRGSRGSLRRTRIARSWTDGHSNSLS